MKQAGPYDIEAVRAEWIGKKSEVKPGRYPVEYDAIRRHCHMVDDDNPLYLDPDFAAGTRFGAVIAPPVMVDYFASDGSWPKTDEGPQLMLLIPTPGDRMINLNQHMEFFRPVRVGDRLSRQMVIVDVIQKPIRLDPKAVWTTAETRITNQDGDLVATVRNTLLVHRAPDEVAADNS
jgi:acyl dehydratase